MSVTIHGSVYLGQIEATNQCVAFEYLAAVYLAAVYLAAPLTCDPLIDLFSIMMRDNDDVVERAYHPSLIPRLAMKPSAKSVAHMHSREGHSHLRMSSSIVERGPSAMSQYTAITTTQETLRVCHHHVFFCPDFSHTCLLSLFYNVTQKDVTIKLQHQHQHTINTT